jgi:hypothetical protein
MALARGFNGVAEANFVSGMRAFSIASLITDVT